MEFTEVIYGQSTQGNSLKAYCSSNFYHDKYLYCVAGIHGTSVEGINVVDRLLLWLRESDKITFPCVFIPILDVDGYLYQQTDFAKGKNLNNLFPCSNRRKGAHFTSDLNTQHALPPEIESLIEILIKYPPQLFLNLRTAANSAKVIAIGDDAVSVANFIAKATNYPLIADNSPVTQTLESFIYDFFLCPVVTIRLPFFTEKKTIADIYEENKKGLEQLFVGQIY